VKRVEDLKPLLYMIEATRYEADFGPAFRALEEVGDDGICLTGLPCNPYIQFAKVDVGYGGAFYMMADHPAEVDRVIEAYHRKYLEAARVVAQAPVEIAASGDNMDCLTCPPRAFLKYGVPYYRDVAEILHPAGKIWEGHWCGRVEGLLPHVPDCGLDVIEAIVPKPMTTLDMADALDACEGKVVIQGGVPAVLMCEEGGSRDDLVRTIGDLLERVGHRPGFVLGMGDNVPANADFHRVKMISEMVEAYNDTVRPQRAGS
jgi:uroporphyrinogen-III decarboxylase